LNVNKKRVMVTGGAGFIGINLVSRLLGENNIVYCVDNFYSSSRNKVKSFLSNNNFRLVEMDMMEDIDVQVDEIYNLACPASPKAYQKDPVYTLKVNFNGVLNMLNLATKYNSKILQASTSEIYGNPMVKSQKENYFGNVNPVGTRACYNEGKRCAEALFFDFNRKYGTNIKVIRIFNTYGPGMMKDDGRVVSNFINQALDNKDITVYGDGFQTRSFCYIEDLVDGMIKMMKTPKPFKGPLNLGNPNEITILDLANKVIEMTNSKSKLIYLPIPKDDPETRRPDISLAKEVLDWEPKVDLEDGLKKTVGYYRKKGD